MYAVVHVCFTVFRIHSSMTNELYYTCIYVVYSIQHTMLHARAVCVYLQIQILLQSTSMASNPWQETDRASLLELEVYVDGEHEYERYMHRDTDGVVTWVEEEASGNDHVFTELHVHGSAQLAFKTNDDQTPLSVFVGYLHADFTGTTTLC